jgi:hypothetical protein
MPKYRFRGIPLPAFDPDVDTAPTKTERYGDHVEVLIALGKDHTASLTFDRDAIEANPELFEKIED